MNTKPLFYDEPSTDSCAARVLGLRPVTGGLGVILDRSPFYPEGGGQPCDLGTLAGLPLRFVGYEGDDIVHVVADTAEARSALEPGQTATCVLDRARRRDHSEQHTAQHLLSATVLRLLGGPTTSFHLGEQYSSIDVDLPAMDRVDADAVEDAVLDVIREDYPIVTHVCPPEDPASFPLRRKPPEGEAVIRILEIDGIDYTPCAGTHLASAGRIGLFRILRAEKYKGMTRVYFVAGGRAFADYRALADGARKAAAVLGVAEGDHAAAVATLSDKAREMELKLRQALDAASAAEAARLAAAAPELGLLSARAQDVAGAKRLAKALASAGRVALVRSDAEPKCVAAGPDGSRDIGAVLKPLCLARGGKGGGGPSLFQAAFPDQASLDRFTADAESALS
ncbi:MAG: alanyl-tRNA editing protein [Spirochaetia bacterium]|nr:alanyl-tRNA editing protein [Spirochaetia bacterium]